MTFKTHQDLIGVLKGDPNSYLPFKGFFSKEIEEDILFFSHLCCSILILSEKYEKLCEGCNYLDYEKKYGPIGNKLRDALEINPFHPSQQEITEILKLLFENQNFTESLRVAHNSTISTNKTLIDIRKKGGEYPYHFIVDITYFVDPSIKSFEAIQEERLSKTLTVKGVLAEFSKKIQIMGLDRAQEWVNFFNALVHLPRGPGYNSMLED